MLNCETSLQIKTEESDEIKSAEDDGIKPKNSLVDSKGYLDIFKDKPIRLTVRVGIPFREHPRFNFVGKLLGPKGNTLRRLQEETMTKMAVLGKGSMKDKEKEEQLRQSKDPRYNHLNEDLHVEVTAMAPPAEAYARMSYALVELRRYMTPDSNDEISLMQMREMEILQAGDSTDKKVKPSNTTAPTTANPTRNFYMTGPSPYVPNTGPIPVPSRNPTVRPPASLLTPSGPGYDTIRNRTLGILDRAGKAMQAPAVGYGATESKPPPSFGYVSYDTSTYGTSPTLGEKYQDSNGYQDLYSTIETPYKAPAIDKARYRVTPY